uniref:Anillin-like n=1 Tax=Diabrotica virgifera virgifera TaxID=50390 RepID=A0A6P7G3A8_DIAVI
MYFQTAATPSTSNTSDSTQESTAGPSTSEYTTPSTLLTNTENGTETNSSEPVGRIIKHLVSIRRNRSGNCEDDARRREENRNLLTNLKTHQLLKKFALQNELINESSKAVNVCRTYPDFFEPQVIIESEKFLLLATIRKEAIKKELQRLEINDEDNLTSGTFKIQNISLYTKRVDPRVFQQCKIYYVCVVHHGAMVYSTKTVRQYGNCIIRFENIFTFENINSDFEVRVSIYGLQQESRPSVWPPKVKGQLLPLPNVVKKSLFELWGTRTVKPSQRNYNVYDLLHTPLDVPMVSTFRAAVTIDFNINVKETGYLALGLSVQGYILWEEKWCTLEGCILKYWNFKLEENTCVPEGEIDLKNCVSYEFTDVDEEICPNPTTLGISVKDEFNNYKYYLLSTENLKDFEKWTHSISTVFCYLKKWNGDGYPRTLRRYL